MKKKLAYGLAYLLIGTNVMAFDNSIFRWEGDCTLKGNTSSNFCMIAASMYEKGKWENASDGKMHNIEGTEEEKRHSAIRLYKIACTLGNEKGCRKADELLADVNHTQHK